MKAENINSETVESRNYRSAIPGRIHAHTHLEELILVEDVTLSKGDFFREIPNKRKARVKNFWSFLSEGVVGRWKIWSQSSSMESWSKGKFLLNCEMNYVTPLRRQECIFSIKMNIDSIRYFTEWKNHHPSNFFENYFQNFTLQKLRLRDNLVQSLTIRGWDNETWYALITREWSAVRQKIRETN